MHRLSIKFRIKLKDKCGVHGRLNKHAKYAHPEVEDTITHEMNFIENFPLRIYGC